MAPQAEETFVAPYEYINSLGEVLSYLDRTSPGCFGIDIETAKLPGYEDSKVSGLLAHLSEIRLIQLYSGSGNVIVLDMFCCRGSAEVKEKLNILLKSSNLIAHNAAFELQHLNKYLGTPLEPLLVECSQSLFAKVCHALTAFPESVGGKGYSLASLVYACSKKTMPKESQLSNWAAPELTEVQIEYAAKDAFACYHGFLWAKNELEVLITKFPQAEGIKAVYSLDKEMAQVISNMTAVGIKVNVPYHKELIASWEAGIQNSRGKLEGRIPVDFNFNSPKQVSNWLLEVLDEETLSEWPKTDSGNLKTDANTVALYGSHLINSENSDVKEFFTYKKFFKLWSTYGNNLLQLVSPISGRLHGSFTLATVVTGRMSGYSPNLQNFPKDPEFRNIFCCEEGNKLIIADYSQVEVRVAALLSEDTNMLAIFNDGQDFYLKMAMSIFGIGSPEAVEKWQRNVVKSVVLGKLYGLGAATMRSNLISKGVDRSLEECKDYIRAFDDVTPGLRTWHKKVLNYVETTSYIGTKLGKIRKLAIGVEGYNYYSKALNFPVQGTAAEINKLACIKVFIRLREEYKARAFLLLTVHDELVVETTESLAEEVALLLEEEMRKAMVEVFPTAALNGLVSAKLCNSWGEKEL